MRNHLRRIAYETNVALRLPAGAERRRLLADYWRLKGRQLRGEHGPGRARLLDWELEYFDLTTFAFVVEEIFVERIYELDLPPNPTIIDCGANIGLASLFFAHRHPGARITAYEPGSTTFGVLADNLSRAGLHSVELHQEAVSDVEGDIELYHAAGPGSVGNTTLTDAHAVTGSERVRAVRLSQQISGRVDLLKLDVEGAEHAVLVELAGSGALAQIDRMVFDYNHHLGGTDELGATLSLLEHEGFGYQLSAALPTPFVARTDQDMIIYAYRATVG